MARFTAEIGRIRNIGKVDTNSISASFQTIALRDAPLGAWNFKESSGNLIDVSGNGNTATAIGSPQYQQVGRGSNTIITNYTNGYDLFLIGKSEWRSLALQTYEAVVKPLSVPPGGNDTAHDAAYGIILSNGYHQGLTYFRTQHLALEVWRSGLTSAETRSTNTFAPNIWYHLVGTVDYIVGEAKLYVNNVLEKTTTFPSGQRSSSNVGDGQYRIGSAKLVNEAYAYPSHMQFEWVAFYNKILSANDVSLHYSALGL